MWQEIIQLRRRYTPQEKHHTDGDEDSTLCSQVPDKYLCKLTGEIMTDPVIACDGHVYERAAIQQYLAQHENILPNGKTNSLLAGCYKLKQEIVAFNK